MQFHKRQQLYLGISVATIKVYSVPQLIINYNYFIIQLVH